MLFTSTNFENKKKIIHVPTNTYVWIFQTFNLCLFSSIHFEIVYNKCFRQSLHLNVYSVCVKEKGKNIIKFPLRDVVANHTTCILQEFTIQRFCFPFTANDTTFIWVEKQLDRYFSEISLNENTWLNIFWNELYNNSHKYKLECVRKSYNICHI